MDFSNTVVMPSYYCEMIFAILSLLLPLQILEAVSLGLMMNDFKFSQ
jgi:hypothetical protein